MEEIQSMSIEEIVDLIADTRARMKKLKDVEDECKKRLLEDGRDKIASETHIVSIQTRIKETFNEDAFIESFSKDDAFEDAIKDTVLDKKIVVNEEALNQAIRDNLIPIEYVVPFNTVTESKVVTVK